MAESCEGKRAVKVVPTSLGTTFAMPLIAVLLLLGPVMFASSPAAAQVAPPPAALSAEGRLELPVVYFTFDDGPDAAVTDRVLDTLRGYQAQATFFVVGSRVGTYPGVSRRIVDEGHAIANHTFSHPQLTALSDGAVRYQFEAANDAIRATTGVTPTCYRPPYGAVNDRVHRIAVESGLGNEQWTAGSGTSVNAHFGLWDIDTVDWQLNYSRTWYELSKVSAGDVVLMHSLRSFSAELFSRWMADNAHRFRFEALPGCGGRTEPPVLDDPAQWYRYQVARLYAAYFRRAPDYDGAKYWNTLYAGGRLTLAEISDYFALSAEFSSRYQSLSQQEFVAVVYENVLDRNPDPSGWSYWTAELDEGRLTRGELMVWFSESTEFVAKAAPTVTGPAWNGDPESSYARGIELNVLPGPDD